MMCRHAKLTQFTADLRNCVHLPRTWDMRTTLAGAISASPGVWRPRLATESRPHESGDLIPQLKRKSIPVVDGATA